MPERRLMPAGAGLAALGLLVLAMFCDTLFVAAPAVLGTGRADLAYQFLPWRDFGFDQLAKGNLALWNPHIYAGAPFFGGMQSALLYPPNWLFLALPLPLAANWSIALDVWLLGAFTCVWALRGGLPAFPAFVAAALATFCAPHFLRVFAGHPTHLAAMAWTPLVFLALDEWLEARRAIWCLVGMAAVAMQTHAGHPQYVYMTALAAACYAVLRLAEPARERLAGAAGLLAIYAGGAALAAAQLFAGIAATAETLRGQTLPFAFAASFGFPPENLITFLAPGFFGDVSTHPYWGRWYWWEASAFIGVGGLALAVYGATLRFPGRAALLGTAALTALLALGDATPLFRVLVDWLPFFDRFRGASKFIFITALVLALFAGRGLDRLLRAPALPVRTLWIVGAMAAVLCAGAFMLRSGDWQPFIAGVLGSGQSYADRGLAAHAAFIDASRDFAVRAVVLGGLSLGLVSALLVLAQRQRRAVFLLGGLAVAEVFVFARLHRPVFDSAQVVAPRLREFLASHPGDYRILNPGFPNSAMSLRAFDAWGYDPAVTRRYAEFITWSTGGDPAQATQYVSFEHLHPLLAMLRVKYVVGLENGVISTLPGAMPPLGRLALIGSYRVCRTGDEVLRALGDPSFDPRKLVILEREPDPAPSGREVRGSARIVAEGTDFMDIEAELASPAVLLVTDAWASGWRATALAGSSRARYELLPANYALRAVPLDAGRHRVRLEYAPAAFRVGAVISLAAWGAWLAACGLLYRRRGRA